MHRRSRRGRAHRRGSTETLQHDDGVSDLVAFAWLIEIANTAAGTGGKLLQLGENIAKLAPGEGVQLQTMPALRHPTRNRQARL
ncbi:MAG: hypothetical protein WA417_11190 [Stellaceae bacterium]